MPWSWNQKAYSYMKPGIAGDLTHVIEIWWAEYAEQSRRAADLEFFAIQWAVLVSQSSVLSPGQHVKWGTLTKTASEYHNCESNEWAETHIAGEWLAE